MSVVYEVHHVKWRLTDLVAVGEDVAQPNSGAGVLSVHSSGYDPLWWW